MVLPVNYAVQGDLVVFRTGDGTKLERAHGTKVAFEVDEVDAGTGSGWSVVVQGVTEEIPATATGSTSRRGRRRPHVDSRAHDHYVASSQRDLRAPAALGPPAP